MHVSPFSRDNRQPPNFSEIKFFDPFLLFLKTEYEIKREQTIYTRLDFI